MRGAAAAPGPASEGRAGGDRGAPGAAVLPPPRIPRGTPSPAAGGRPGEERAGLFLNGRKPNGEGGPGRGQEENGSTGVGCLGGVGRAGGRTLHRAGAAAHRHLRRKELHEVPRGQSQSFPMRAPFLTAHCSPASHCGGRRALRGLPGTAPIRPVPTLFARSHPAPPDPSLSRPARSRPVARSPSAPARTSSRSAAPACSSASPAPPAAPRSAERPRAPSARRRRPPSAALSLPPPLPSPPHQLLLSGRAAATGRPEVAVAARRGRPLPTGAEQQRGRHGAECQPPAALHGAAESRRAALPL